MRTRLYQTTTMKASLRAVLTVMLTTASLALASAQFILSFNVTEPTCFGLATGAVTVTPIGGIGPYSYEWSTGGTTPTITGITAGTYGVTVTGANGVVSQNITVDQPTQVLANVSGDTCRLPVTLFATGWGGTGPYTYTWDGMIPGQTLTVTTPGTYCVTVVDATWCGIVECIKITAGSINLNVQATNLTCPNVNTGQVQATVTGGAPPYTFQWSNGLQGPVISNLAAGTYTVTVTDTRGCSVTATATVTSPPPLIAAITPTNPTCTGLNNGSVTATATGGTPPYTYQWNNGALGPTRNNLGPGTYTVTVRDLNNCIVTQSVTLAPLSNLMVGAVPMAPTCPGVNNGSVTANPSGGVPPYTYVWSIGGGGQVRNNLAPGTYSVTVTDALNCTATATAVVPAAPVFTIAMQSTNATTCGANNGTASVVVTQGAPPFTYQWSNGATGTSIISNLSPGTYSVTVTGAGGCTANGSVTITQPPLVFVNITASPRVCAGTFTGSATATATGGTPPFNFVWSTTGIGPAITGLPAGQYSVTVTDANGCQAFASANIQQAPNPVVGVNANPIVCGLGNTGTATAFANNGTPPYSFNWSTGANGPNVSGLTTGTYTVTATDANQCVGTGSVNITVVNVTVNITRQAVLCFGGNTGSAIASGNGGMPPYTYVWSNGVQGPVNANLAAGFYTVTVTDFNGCSATQTAIISQPPALAVTINSSALQLCPGAADATLTAQPVGGTPAYSYLWSTGATTQSIPNQPAGTYSVTVTDANGCTATASFTITQLQALQVTITGAEIVCGESNSGTAGVIVTGGTGPYTYLWNTGANSEAVDGLGTGVYSVTVTDLNGCTSSAEIGIRVVDDFTASITPRNLLCFGDNSGSALITAGGGNTPYTYLWSNGTTGPEAANLSAGLYSAIVTDANGCVLNVQTTIQQPPLLQVSASAGNISCAGINNGTVIATATGGSAPYQYLWSNNQTGPTLSALAAGTYTVTVFDVNNCTATTTVQITQPASFTVAINGTGPACAGASTGTATATATGGVGPYSYLWSNGMTGPVRNGLPAGTYSVTATDANGCTASVSIVLSQPQAIVPAVQVLQQPCTGAATGALTVSATGGTPPYSFTWSNGVSGAGLLNIQAGTYTVTVTDSRGCTATISQTLTALSSPTCSVEIASYVVNGNDGGLSVLVSGGTGPYSFLWSNGSTSANPANLAPGAYSVTVTDANGCTSTCTRALPVASGVGDFVWRDDNQNGIQDPGEPGIPGVTVIISGTQENDPYADTTVTNGNGLYFFNVPPGEYKITFILPGGTDLTPTVANAGNNDNRDSDMDPVMFMTSYFVVPPGVVDLSWDAGFVPPCINITNAGTIGPAYQFLCGPGNVPAPFVNVTLPSGGTDVVPFEYMWMRSYVGGPFDNGFWEILPNSNSPFYQPGPLSRSAYFARCARRDDCGPFLESNVVFVEVGSISVANINGPEIVCLSQSATFTATGTAPGALIQWTFGPGGVVPAVAVGPSATVNFTSFGSFTVTLTVTQNGCTATNSRTITVTNSPIYCGNGLVINAEINSAREVQIEWELPENEPEHLYVIERSADGVGYDALGELRNHHRINAGQKQFLFTDTQPKAGRNYYRIKYVSALGDTGYSNIEEVILLGDSKLVLLYPNPVSGEAMLELFETFNGDVTLDIIAANGMQLQRMVLPREVKRQPLDFASYPAGVYFIRLRYGDVELKRLKVVKM